MRFLDAREIRKRGCPYCTQRVKKRRGFILSSYCPHDECPYHELDEYETYTKYLKAKGDLIFLRRRDKK